jgi:hypothetical protein
MEGPGAPGDAAGLCALELAARRATHASAESLSRRALAAQLGRPLFRAPAALKQAVQRAVKQRTLSILRYDDFTAKETAESLLEKAVWQPLLDARRVDLISYRIGLVAKAVTQSMDSIEKNSKGTQRVRNLATLEAAYPAAAKLNVVGFLSRLSATHAGRSNSETIFRPYAPILVSLSVPVKQYALRCCNFATQALPSFSSYAACQRIPRPSPRSTQRLQRSVWDSAGAWCLF